MTAIEKQPELSYYPLPDSEYADVIICKNEELVTQTNEDGGSRVVYQYDCNSFRTKITKATIEENIDFYLTFEPDKDVDYPTKIANLEAQLDETQLALCDCYELLEGLSS